MSEAEYRLLCNHLGHSLDVHTRFYRLRETTAEYTKVGKMLMASTQELALEDDGLEAGPSSESGPAQTPLKESQ